MKKGPPKNLILNTFVNLNFYQIKIKEMNEKDKMHLKTILQCTIVVKNTNSSHDITPKISCVSFWSYFY